MMAAEPRPERRRQEDAAGAPEPARPPSLPRRLAAEGFGTFALALVEVGGAMLGGLAPDTVTPAARAVAAGLIVMAMIHTIGPVSGAHMNPAVSLGFALRGVFPWREVPSYWCEQVGGAALAAGAWRSMLGPVAHVGAPAPGFGGTAAFGTEVLLTALLVSVILGTATHHSVVGPNAAGAVGGTVALAGLFSRPVSGAVMNPARALAPALAGGMYPELWVYVSAPFLGAVVAVGLAWVLHGPRRDSEREAAEGRDDA